MSKTDAGGVAGSLGPARPMPRRHDDLTAEWLTEALRSGGLDATVGSFSRRPMGEGVGMMATLELIDLEYREGSGPATVVVKLPAVNDANRAVAEMFDIYRREVLFYRDVADRTPACTPRILFADVDGSSDFVLIMDDMSDYRLGDQLVGCGVADAELAMVELGKLHASFWDNVDGDEFAFVPFETPSKHGDVLRDGAVPGWDVTEAVFGDAVPESLRSVKARYLAAIGRMQEWMVTAPITIVHGDFRMDNIFFGAAPHHVALAAIDWQGCLRSKGIRDVGYLLSQSMQVEDRRASERDLVNLWHQTLVDGGVTGYSADQAWQDYLRAVLFLWTMVVVIAGSLDASNERGRAWMTEMVRRSAAAIEDHDLLTLLPEFE